MARTTPRAVKVSPGGWARSREALARTGTVASAERKARREVLSVTLITYAPNLDLNLPPLNRARQVAALLDPKRVLGQAAHIATLSTDEVGVGLFIVVACARDLESPEVVPEVAARRESRIREVREVAIQGRAVVAELGEAIADLSVAERGVRLAQTSQDRSPCGRRLQPRRPQGRAQLEQVLVWLVLTTG